MNLRFLGPRLLSTLADPLFVEETLKQIEAGVTQACVSTFARLLRECGNSRSVVQARRVHQLLLASGHSQNPFLGNLVVQMYRKCRRVDDAKQAFDSIAERNVFSWSIMIAAFAEEGQYVEALKLFRRMEIEGPKPDCCVIGSVLRVCASLGDEETGGEIHSKISSGALDSDTVVETALLDMYSKAGNLNEARRVFDSMRERDVISWNAMIAAYMQQGDRRESIRLYREMINEGVPADEFTFSTALAACGDRGEASEVHSCVSESGMEQDSGISCALITCFARCGSIESSEIVFRRVERKNVITWTCMMGAYHHLGLGNEALRLYSEMNLEGVQPNSVTFINLLSAFPGSSNNRFFNLGREIHRRILESGLHSSLPVQNSLLKMYTRCGCLSEAERVFTSIPEANRDLVLWNSMLSSYSQLGDGSSALDHYGRLGIRGLEPDEVTFTSVLGACGKLGDLDQGKRIHAHVRNTEFMPAPAIQAALVNMYSRCASMKNVKKFVLRKTFNLVFCNSLLSSAAMFSHTRRAMRLFTAMQHEGYHPSGVTFISLLASCSGTRSFHQGGEIFRCMISDYGMKPGVEHYRCMIHLLGRSGFLRSARKLIRCMEYEPGDAEWTILLGACRFHGNLKVGRQAAKRALEVNPGNETARLLLLNLNSYVFRLEEFRRRWRKRVRGVREKMIEKDHAFRVPNQPTWKSLPTLTQRGKKRRNPYVSKLNWRGFLKTRRRQQLALWESPRFRPGPVRMKKFREYLDPQVWSGQSFENIK